MLDILKVAAKPSMCFVKHKDHGYTLQKRLKDAGITSAFVYGKHSREERQRQLSELDKANVQVVICTVIFQEGIDLPSIKSVVIGAAESSAVAAVQRRGRGTRTFQGEGGDTFELWDILDMGQRWLDKHSEARMAAYESRGDAVKVGWD